MNTPNRTLSREAFNKALAFGQMAETDIAKWLLARGHKLLPGYDIEYNSGKGPRLFSSQFQLVTPDFLAWCDGRILWIEAKHKSTFTWHFKSAMKGKPQDQCWQTGIDLHHWNSYQRVAKETGLPVWILFLHRTSQSRLEDMRHGAPRECPTGLFGEEITKLVKTFDHTDSPKNGAKNHSKYGMVYWTQSVLKKLAELYQVIAMTVYL